MYFLSKAKRKTKERRGCGAPGEFKELHVVRTSFPCLLKRERAFVVLFVCVTGSTRWRHAGQPDLLLSEPEEEPGCRFLHGVRFDEAR